MANLDEILARVNQRTAEIQAKVADIRGTRFGTEGRDRLIGSFENDVILGLGGDDLISVASAMISWMEVTEKTL